MKIEINNNSCRVCLENVGEIPFFQDHGEEIIAEIISSLFNIDVIYDVNLPTTICTNCLENIKLSILTKNIIVNSESVLRKYLKSNITIGESAENLSQIKVEKEEPIVTPELVELKAEEIKIERPEPEDSSRDFEDEQYAGFQIIKVKSLTSFNPDPQSEPTVSPKMYDCEICDFKAVTHKRLIYHKKIHTAATRQEGNHDPAKSKPKRVACKYCGKKLLILSMKQHVHDIHSGEKPFSCSYCDKTFSRPDSLNIHVQIHFKSMDIETKQSYRKHKCDECDKSFSNSTLLKLHKIVHSGVKEHVCLHCGKQFALDAYLKRHVQLVHEKSQNAIRETQPQTSDAADICDEIRPIRHLPYTSKKGRCYICTYKKNKNIFATRCGKCANFVCADHRYDICEKCAKK